MSARTFVRDSDDEASDIEGEGEDLVERPATTTSNIRVSLTDAPKNGIVLDASGEGWNLQPTLQQQFLEHQPHMMFSDGSSTIPDTTWTQKVAYGQDPASLPSKTQSPLHIHGHESQRSKSSLGWSEFEKETTAADSMPNLENLKPRAQAANTAIAPQSEPTEQAMGQIEEDEMDHPMLLPIDEAFTPPGTPKLLELSTPRPVADSETVLTLSEIPRADTVPAKYNHNADILPDEIWQQVMDRLEPTPPIQDEIPLAPFAVQMKREKRKTSTSSHASINEIMVNVPEPVPKKRQKRGRPRKETTTVNAQSQSSAEAQDGEGVEIITVHADNPLVADDNDFSAPDILEVAQETQQLEHMAAETPTTTVEKKKRGRQSKTKICIAVDIPYDSGIADESLDALPKVDHVEKKLVKKRGRPKKAIGDKDAEQPETKILEVADHAVSNADAIEGVDQNFDSQCDVENVPNKPASPDIVCNEVVSDKAMMVQLESKKAISKAKAGLAQVLKTATNHRVGLSRRMRIPSLLKVVRK